MKTPARRVAVTGIMCALAAAVSYAEGFLPVIPLPGAKPGLSNIVTMAALYYVGAPAAFAVTAVKGLTALTRGAAACMMSLSGGLVSLAVMAALYFPLKKRISWLGVGVAGAAAHNAAQLAAASVIAGQALTGLLPPLLAAGIAAGIITGTAMNLLNRNLHIAR